VRDQHLHGVDVDVERLRCGAGPRKRFVTAVPDDRSESLPQRAQLEFGEDALDLSGVPFAHAEVA
jgi:hypothetical protein